MFQYINVVAMRPHYRNDCESARFPDQRSILACQINRIETTSARVTGYDGTQAVVTAICKELSVKQRTVTPAIINERAARCFRNVSIGVHGSHHSFESAGISRPTFHSACKIPEMIQKKFIAPVLHASIKPQHPCSDTPAWSTCALMATTASMTPPCQP